MTKTTEELLKSSVELLTTLKQPGRQEEAYRALNIRYPRVNHYITALAPVGYIWQPITIEYYQPYGVGFLDKLTELEDTTIVIHGHDVDKKCFAPDMCHVLEYRPVGNESEIFLKLFSKFQYQRKEI